MAVMIPFEHVKKYRFQAVLILVFGVFLLITMNLMVTNAVEEESEHTRRLISQLELQVVDLKQRLRQEAASAAISVPIEPLSTEIDAE